MSFLLSKTYIRTASPNCEIISMYLLIYGHIDTDRRAGTTCPVWMSTNITESPKVRKKSTNYTAQKNKQLIRSTAAIFVLLFFATRYGLECVGHHSFVRQAKLGSSFVLSNTTLVFLSPYIAWGLWIVGDALSRPIRHNWRPPLFWLPSYFLLAHPLTSEPLFLWHAWSWLRSWPLMFSMQVIRETVRSFHCLSNTVKDVSVRRTESLLEVRRPESSKK